jgi:DNA modification methylase
VYDTEEPQIDFIEDSKFPKSLFSSCLNKIWNVQRSNKVKEVPNLHLVKSTIFQDYRSQKHVVCKILSLNAPHIGMFSNRLFLEGPF